MNATIEDLVATIGEQTIELRLLKKQVIELQQGSNLKDQEIIALKEIIDKATTASENKEEKKEKK